MLFVCTCSYFDKTQFYILINAENFILMYSNVASLTAGGLPLGNGEINI